LAEEGVDAGLVAGAGTLEPGEGVGAGANGDGANARARESEEAERFLASWADIIAGAMMKKRHRPTSLEMTVWVVGRVERVG
jgi:hypothetical protein